MTRSSWQQRIERAGVLAQRHPASAEILRFYQRLAGAQCGLFAAFPRPPEALTPELVRAHFPKLLDAVVGFGTEELARRAGLLRAAASQAWEDLVIGYWRNPDANGDEFFARAFLQPYAELVCRSPADAAQDAGWAARCPSCGRRPQAAVLHEEAHGARRWLVCSLCQGEWEYRRVLCPACNEDSFQALPVYVAEEFPHMRVEACDTCGAYLLGVDMTRDGTAVPCVDELAAVPLNLWAQERGFHRLQPNLLGL